MPLKKARAKKLCEFWVFSFLWFFRGFLLLTFVRGMSESRHQRIWNQHKILRFLIPILIFFKQKIFWVIIALFAYFKCKCEKNCTFSNILRKVKRNFFGNIYQSPFDSYWNSKKSIKLKPPTVHCTENTHKDKTLYGVKAVHSDIRESWIPAGFTSGQFYFRSSLLPAEDDVPDNAHRCGN